MASYYNENDPFAAAWLRELIKAKLIADGEVDERSIADVRADDLRGFTQCHFFAGIGGWSYALRLAGWPDERAVWTGSCPCQPFSSAGAQAGGHDPRDLWPTWFQLVTECRPPVLFGEQVEAAIGHGWLDRLCDDLEAEDYAVGACGLPGPSVGAFDIRARLWFVAESASVRRDGWEDAGFKGTPCEQERHLLGESLRLSDIGDMADAHSGRQQQRDTCERTVSESDAHSVVGDTDGSRHGTSDGQRTCTSGESASQSCEGNAAEVESSSFWARCDWLHCADGKARPVEPGTFPLAHGVSARVGRLRGYGNAIKPQVAQVFIKAYLDSLNHSTRFR